MAVHELILVEMILPRRYGGDKDARQPSNLHRNQEETKRLQYHDHKLLEPQIKEQFTKRLKELSVTATVTINELLDTTPQNTSQSQTKADVAFEVVRTAIDTAAKEILGFSMKSVTDHNNTRPPKQSRDPPPEILNLIEEKETLRQELKYIRAGPATQNLADNVRAWRRSAPPSRRHPSSGLCKSAALVHAGLIVLPALFPDH